MRSSPERASSAREQEQEQARASAGEGEVELEPVLERARVLERVLARAAVLERAREPVLALERASEREGAVPVPLRAAAVAGPLGLLVRASELGLVQIPA